MHEFPGISFNRIIAKNHASNNYVKQGCLAADNTVILNKLSLKIGLSAVIPPCNFSMSKLF